MKCVLHLFLSENCMQFLCNTFFEMPTTPPQDLRRKPQPECLDRGGKVGKKHGPSLVLSIWLLALPILQQLKVFKPSIHLKGLGDFGTFLVQ